MKKGFIKRGSNLLNKTEMKFVKKYIENGEASKSVQQVFGIKNKQYAATKGARLMAKPKIIKAIADAFPIDYLASKHTDLFNQKEVEYFTFPKKMSDEEIKGHVEGSGLTLVNVRESMVGKMAFYTRPDTAALKAALDMGYKLKGSYAAEKTVNMNVEVESTDMIKELTNKINEIHRGTEIKEVPSDESKSEE